MSDPRFCPRCQQTLTKADFYKRSARCKECIKEERRTRWRDDAETLRAQARARYARDSEKHRKQKRDSVARDPERHRERNRQWLREHGAAWRAARDPRTARDVQLRSLYGISIDEYEQMFTVQNGRCKVCKDRPARGLFVDHCHTTGEVRGLLCHHCNTGIGLFSDSPELLYRAIVYLTGGEDDDSSAGS